MFAMLLCLTLAGCGPKFHVFRESTAISLRGARSFVIAPIRFDGHMDNADQETFEAWYARRHPRMFAAFDRAYRTMGERAAERLALRTGYSVGALEGSVAPGTFVITPRIVRAHIRENVGNGSTFCGSVDVEASVYTGDGQEAAVITYSTAGYCVGGTFVDDPDISPWIRELAIDAGNRLALFLPTRTDPPVATAPAR